MIKENNFRSKEITIGALIIFLYLTAISIPDLPLALVGIRFNSLNIILKQVYLISYEIVIISIIFIIYRKDLSNNFKDLKANKFKYFKKYINYWFIMLFLMNISNIIITKFTTMETTVNQTDIINQLKQYAVYTTISTVITAPILEELVFRMSFKKIFKNNFLFIITSTLIFSLLHVATSVDNLVNLLFLIPYGISAIVLGYAYTKQLSSIFYMPFCLLSKVALLLFTD